MNDTQRRSCPECGSVALQPTGVGICATVDHDYYCPNCQTELDETELEYVSETEAQSRGGGLNGDSLAATLDGMNASDVSDIDDTRAEVEPLHAGLGTLFAGALVLLMLGLLFLATGGMAWP